MTDIQEIEPTEEMVEAARLLKTGKIIYCYRDGTSIRMETENGRDPYVWRDNEWRPMRG